jgi:hypothetical protein
VDTEQREADVVFKLAAGAASCLFILFYFFEKNDF